MTWSWLRVHGARFGRVVWIDLFAVRQWPGNDADIDFRNVINKCQAFIVSVSPVNGLKKFMTFKTEACATFLATDKGKAAKKRTPFFCLWCNVEIAAAYNNKIPIVIKGEKARKEDETNTKVATSPMTLPTSPKLITPPTSPTSSISCDKLSQMAKNVPVTYACVIDIDDFHKPDGINGREETQASKKKDSEETQVSKKKRFGRRTTTV